MGSFFGIGLPELAVIMGLALLIVGPERLPQFVGDIARWIKQARSYSANLRSDFTSMIADLEGDYGELSKEINELRQEMRGISGSVNAEFRSVNDTIQKATSNSPALPSPAPQPTPPPHPRHKRNPGDWWDAD